LEGAVVFGGISALGAALFNMGIPKDDVIKYESALKVDKYILMVHGSVEEIDRAHEILADTKVWEPA